MKSTFERLYNATPFDPDSREDQIGEAARRTLIKAAIETDVTRSVCNGADMPYLLGGLLVGIAQIMKSAATGIPDDEIDAAIRVSIIQVAPWAVDMMRASQGKSRWQMPDILIIPDKGDPWLLARRKGVVCRLPAKQTPRIRLTLSCQCGGSNDAPDDLARIKAIYAREDAMNV